MLFRAALSATETFFQIPPSEDQNSVPKRAVAVCVAVANRADQALEVRQNAASPPWQVCLCSNVRAFARIALALFICITAALLNFNGPGAPVILPSVEYIVSILPEDLQKAVRDDDIHPIDTVRNQLRLASRSNVLSDNSAQRPETVQHSEN